MGKTKYILFIIFSLALVVFGTQKSHAAEVAADIPTSEVKVVINEVMANPAGADSDHEWIEIANFSDEAINLVTWQLKIYNDPIATTPKKTISFSPVILNPESYLVVVSDANIYKPCDACTIYNGQFTSTAITNSKGKITLSNIASGYEHDFIWNEEEGEGYTMEIVGPPNNDNYSEWLPSLIIGGTPGAENSVSNLSKPQLPILLSPTDEENIILSDEIEFTWQKDDENLTYEIIVGTDLADPIIDEPNLSTTNYPAEDLSVGTYYWQIIATNGLYSTPSAVYSFTIIEPKYSDAIIINEISPDPASGEEFIELYNNSDENVSLKNWALEDLKGSIHRYVIATDITINKNSYLVIKKSQSGITLNNDSDGVRLIRPDNKILYETPIFTDGEKSWGFARDKSGKWSWTTKLTPGGLNNIVVPVVDEEEITPEDDETAVPINTEAVEIRTGTFEDYENFLVKIIGTVVETSGNTFYLDDGTGRVKVYIQEATGIDKPEMHVGDVFEVTGIVNVYRDVYRILPRGQEDVKLISAFEKQTTTTTATKKVASSATSKTSSASKATPKSTAKNMAQNGSDTNVSGTDTDKAIKIEGYKTPFWIELVKSFSALTLVLFILFIIKVRKIHREKIYTHRTLGGNFGDDET